MMPSTFVRFLCTKVRTCMEINVHMHETYVYLYTCCKCEFSPHFQPSIIPRYLNHLLTLLPKVDVPTLIRLANLFDPSHSTMRPLLIRSHSSRRRCSTYTCTYTFIYACLHTYALLLLFLSYKLVVVLQCYQKPFTQYVVVVDRSHSTGSLMSVADSLSSGGGLGDEEEEPKLEEYIEMFLTILIILNVRRKRKATSRV